MNRWRPIHVIEIACLATAVVCLGWFGFNWIATEVDQQWANYQLQSALRSQQPSVPESVDVSPEPAVRKVPDPGPRPARLYPSWA